MNELDEKIEKSKKALKLAAEMSKEYYGKPLIIAYSGGKDSDVMLWLAEQCLKPDEFEVLNSHTSVDAPPTVYHIREVFKRLNSKGIKATEQYPLDKDGKQITMWNLIPQKQIPPTRLIRYCCSVLKETSTPNRMCALGVRKSESVGRGGRDTFATRGGTKKQAMFFSYDHAEEVHRESKEINDPAWDCTLIKTMKEHGDILVNPIYEWSDYEIWECIRNNNIPVNILYSMGYKRVGCVGCPMASYREMQKEFKDFPTYKAAYINAFAEMMKQRKTQGKNDTKYSWKTGEDVFNWWIQEYQHNCKGQMTMDFSGNEVKGAK